MAINLFGRTFHIGYIIKYKSFLLLRPLFLWSHFNYIRVSFLKSYGARIGSHTIIARKIDVREPSRIFIGTHVMINKNVVLDGRGGLVIGNNVDIAQDAYIWTAQHDYNDDHHKYVSLPTNIGDYVWIGSRATLLPGVKIGKGAVVAAGAVVTRDVSEMMVCGGVPAKVIAARRSRLLYTLQGIAK